MAAPGTRLFVGRRAELDALDALVARAKRGGGRLVVVDGEPGIGKTRLVDELADAALESGFRVLRAAAEQLERERPFGVVVDALDVGRADDPERARIAALLYAPGDERADLRFHLVERLSELVEREVERAPLLLVAEDVHWADPSSLLMLLRLSRRVSSLPCVVLLTCRPVPRSPELVRLLDAVADLEGLHLRLQPLAPEEVAELAAALVAAEPGPTLVDALRGTGGNPLFVRELVAALEDAHAVEVRAGRAEVLPNIRPAPSLRLTVLSRLLSLSRESLEALRIASVLGESFSPDDLAGLTGWGAVDVLARLGEALASGFLRDEGRRLTFRHDVVREALYLDLSPTLRASLHRHAADVLAAAGRPAREVAVHFSLGAVAGDSEAISWLAQGAREVVGHAPPVAVQLLERAVELTLPGDPRRVELTADLIRPLVWTGQLSRAERVARELLADVDDARLAATVGAALSAVLFLQYRLGELEQLCNDMLELDLEGSHRWLFAAMAVMPAIAGGEFGRALAFAEEAAVAGTELGEIGAVPLANTRGIVARLQGRFAEAAELGGCAVAAARTAPVADGLLLAPRQVLANAQVFRSWSLLAADRFEEAAAALRAAMHEYERIGAAAYVNLCHRGLANVALASGAWDDARAELEVARQLEDETQAHGLDTHQADPSLVLSVHSGRLRDARRRLEELDRTLPAERWRRGNSWFLPMKAEVLAAEGEDRLALETLAKHCRDGQATGAVRDYRLFGRMLVCLALASGRRDLAESAAAGAAELAERAGGLATTNGIALLCRGLVEDDPALLTAAVEAYRAGGRPLDLALALEDAASAMASRGRQAEAVRSLEEALEIFERLGAARDRARVSQRLRSLGVRRGARGRRRSGRFGWESLTPSELRVVELLTQGLSNPQIAEHLYVSRRTVRTHLESVFRKLQVKSRAELAALAARRRR